MEKLLDLVLVKRRHLYVNEKNLTNLLKVLNRHYVINNISVGNCGWEDDPDKWFVNFDACNKKWDEIRSELNVVRVWTNSDIPHGDVDGVYSND